MARYQLNEDGILEEGEIHGWFGLTYSSYLVLPRSLMEGMPLAWQAQMVGLLNQMRDMYEDVEDNYAVNLRSDNGRFKTDPLANYRHPNPLPYVSGKDPTSLTGPRLTLFHT